MELHPSADGPIVVLTTVGAAIPIIIAVVQDA